MTPGDVVAVVMTVVEDCGTTVLLEKRSPVMNADGTRNMATRTRVSKDDVVFPAAVEVRRLITDYELRAADWEKSGHAGLMSQAATLRAVVTNLRERVLMEEP